MTLQMFLSEVARLVHEYLASGNFGRFVLASAFFTLLFFLARFIFTEKLPLTEYYVVQIFILGGCLAIIDSSFHDGDIAQFILGFSLFAGAGSVVYRQIVQAYQLQYTVSWDDMSYPLRAMGMMFVGTVVYSYVVYGVAVEPSASSIMVEAQSAPAPSSVNAPQPIPVDTTPKKVPQEAIHDDYHLAPNTTLIVERAGLSVRNSACSSSEPATYTDGEKIILSQYDEVKITDEPIAYCTKGKKSYPWALVSFQVASGVTINEGRGMEGWVSLCDTRPQDDTVAKHPVCKK